MLTLGQLEENIVKQALRAGHEIPDNILNAPQLREGLHVFIQAFFDLDTERSHSMGATAIPWSAIASYADAYDFTREQKDDLLFLVKSMDADHLERVRKKQATK